MKMSKLLLGVALVMGLTLGLSGSAFAVAITCGGCHGSAPLGNPINSDNCTNTARGLHGTHVNYSSLTFKKTITANGKCSYCHAAVADAKGIASRTHNNNFINVTGNTVGSVNTLAMSYNAATKTCTNSCHKNRAQTAKWGNYTATVVGGITLNCRSCHDDINDKTGLTGVHNTHLLSNTTTAAGVLMSAANNAGCVACHPNANTDLATFKAGNIDNGINEVYGHAQDGTNVVPDNATLNGAITSANKAGLGTTCVTTCHPRAAATLTWGATWTQAAGTGCDMCHYWAAATSDTTNIGTGALGGAHSRHFRSPNNIACTVCHPTHVTTAYDNHGAKLPAAGYNAKIVKAGMTYNTAAKTCTASGIGCHGAGTTSAWNGALNAGCAGCHAYPGATGFGLGDWAAGNGHAVKYGAPVVNTHLLANASYNKDTDTFAGVIASATQCGMCHGGAVHNNGTTELVPSGNGQCGGNFTIKAGKVSGSNVVCSSVKCHSGKDTPNWW
jgi:hypothetical protein